MNTQEIHKLMADLYKGIEEQYNLDLGDDANLNSTANNGKSALFVKQEDGERVPPVIFISRELTTFTEILTAMSWLIDHEPGEIICCDTDVDSYDSCFGFDPEHEDKATYGYR